jgi:hypothetical protein
LSRHVARGRPDRVALGDAALRADGLALRDLDEQAVDVEQSGVVGNERTRTGARPRERQG